MMTIKKNKSKLEKKLLDISKLVGEPIIVRLGVRNQKVEILNIIKCFEEDDDDEISSSTKLDTHIDISKPISYIG